MKMVCTLCMVLCLAPAAAPAGVDGSEPNSAPVPSRPAWILGKWWSSPHNLTLRSDGSASFLFGATLSGGPDKIRLGAAGKDSWSLELRDPNSQQYWLEKLGPGYLVRRGGADNVVYLMDPLTHCEVPFYRVGDEAAMALRRIAQALEESERAMAQGDRREELRVGRLLSELRGISNSCPLVTARASFILARALDQRGERKQARPYYDYCVYLREQAFETPHPDLTRACFFAGGCVDRDSGYGQALWYRTRAMLVQQQVLAQVEAGTNTPAWLLKATRQETAAVYVECAAALGQAALTPAVVALYPAAFKLARETGDQVLADTIATRLFSYLLSRPGDHRHTRMLFSLSEYLDECDARRPSVKRNDLPGWILRHVRLVQELQALEPPRSGIARRLALRAVALGRFTGADAPPYIHTQILPEIIKQAGISDEIARLERSTDKLWPATEHTVARADLLKCLHDVSEPVDLAREFPGFELSTRPFPQGFGNLADITPQLTSMLPGMPERPSLDQVEKAIKEQLAELAAGDEPPAGNH